MEVKSKLSKMSNKDSIDDQNNCEVNYKRYLKCKNNEDKGDINWGY